MKRTNVTFPHMPYERPSADAIKEALSTFTAEIKKASSYEEVVKVFTEKETYSRHISTMHNVASIRHSIDTRDEFYDEEMKYWSQVQPEIREYEEAFKKALVTCPYQEELKKDYGELLFIDAAISERSFSPEIIPLMQQENELTRSYEKLLATAKVSFEGKTYTIPQMSPFKTDPDDERRLAAWKAEGQWYKDNQAEMDRIYDELVKLRTEMGRKMGHEDYLPLGYDRMGRNCYGRKDVQAFREAVVTYIVPIASALYQHQAERLGKTYPMSYADNALEFRSGNPRPFGTPEEILKAGQKFYSELSPETKEFFDTMMEYQLLDVISKEGKEGGGYCTGLEDYRVPFIFANFAGTQGDVSVVTHEAGHAFAYWMNADRTPTSQIWPSMEGCEVHSMSMEFFAWPWAESFFGKDTQKFYYSHLAEALTFIPYGTMVDHYQDIVYSHPEYTPAERHQAWKELIGIYQPWIRLDGDIPFYSEGQGWQRQHHIYSLPLYYIDYCLAQTVSLEYWALMQEDQKKAWEKYMAYTLQGGTQVFTKLLENAGMESPFNAETLKHVAEVAAQWLAHFDLSQIH